MRQLVATTVLFGCLCIRIAGQPALTISLVHGTPAERQTETQLRRLLRTYDVSPWLYTRSIAIDDSALPHSHPVLTLSTRHLHDDVLLLSTFVHEEFHWLLVQRDADTPAAIKDLQILFPTVPAPPPQGANGVQSTYLHLLVGYLEYRADQKLLGELAARQIMQFWAGDHYMWVYKTVLERTSAIADIIVKHRLLAEGL